MDCFECSKESRLVLKSLPADLSPFILKKPNSGWSISRILSGAEAPVQSSLWAVRRRAARCSLPGAGPSHRREGRVRRRAVSHRPQTISPLLGLAPDGGYLATCITADAGGLLHHLFTITLHPKGWKGCLFLWPFSGGFTPPRVLSDVVLYGVRTFLDPDNAGPRLPNQPELVA